MTIFLEIAKTAIISRLIGYIKLADRRPRRKLSQIGSFFGVGYNTELCDAKVNVAESLKDVVKAMDDLANDNATYHYLYTMLWDTKDQAKKKSTEAHEKTEGKFGPLMTTTSNVLTELYRRLQKTALLNIDKKSNDPYKFFQFYMACYLAEKISEEYQPRGIIKSLLEHPIISNAADLAAYKNDLVLLGLAKCKTIVPKLVNNEALFETRKEAVLTVIENIKSKNIAMCNELAMRIPLTGILPTPLAFINVGGFDATFAFDPGDLAECLEMAETAVMACHYIPGEIIIDPPENEEKSNNDLDRHQEQQQEVAEAYTP